MSDIDELTEERRRQIRRRALAALEGADENRELFAARQAANREARLLGETGPRISQQPAPAQAPQRASTRPEADGERSSHAANAEYWQKWEAWARALADQQIKTFAEQYSDAIGQAVGEIMNEHRAAIRAETKAALEEVKAEIAALEQRAVLKPVRPTLIIDAEDIDAA